MNDADKQRAWSKYSKDSSAYQKINPTVEPPVVKNAKQRKKEANELRKKQKEEKLDSLIGPLKDDSEFKEFLSANKAIKSNDNLWHNDIHLDNENKVDEDSTSKPDATIETKSAAKEDKENVKGKINHFLTK